MKIVFALFGRNDNWQENFLDRTQFCINYTLYNLEKSNLIDKFEYSFLDWASNKEKPIHKNFTFIKKKFEDKVKFLYVDPDLAKKITPNYYNNSIFVEKAHNLNLANIDADFIINTNTDIFFSKTSLINLINLLKNSSSNQIKLNNSYFLIPRIVIDNDFLKRNPSYEMIDRYIERLNFSSQNIYHPALTYTGGGFGAILASQNVWKNIDGFDESLMPNLGNDEEICCRAAKTNIIYNLGLLGVTCFKLQNTINSQRFLQISKFGRKSIKKLNEIYDKSYLINAKKIEIQRFTSRSVNEINSVSNLKYFLSNGDKLYSNGVKIFNYKNILNFSKQVLADDENFYDFYLTLIIVKLLHQYNLFNYVSIGYSSKTRISILAKNFLGVEICSIDFIDKDTDISNKHQILAKFLKDKKNSLRLINAHEINNIDMKLIFDDILNEKNIVLLHLHQSNLNLDFFTTSNSNKKIGFIIVDKDKTQLLNNPNFKKIFENKKFLLYANRSLDVNLNKLKINLIYAIYIFLIFKINFKIFKIFKFIKILIK